jgi:hypothetical protein
VKFSLVSFSVGTGKPRELLWFGVDEEEAAMIEDVEEVGSDTKRVFGEGNALCSRAAVYLYGRITKATGRELQRLITGIVH